MRFSPNIRAAVYRKAIIIAEMPVDFYVLCSVECHVVIFQSFSRRSTQ